MAIFTSISQIVELNIYAPPLVAHDAKTLAVQNRAFLAVPSVLSLISTNPPPPELVFESQPRNLPKPETFKNKETFLKSKRVPKGAGPK